MSIDPVTLSQELIRCPSVTPDDAGALGVLERALTALDFHCDRVTFSDHNTPDIENLYARYGNDGPNLCFAGHTDVVPIGNETAWSIDPFAAEIRNGILIGRGAVDMKPAIAAWISACADILKRGDIKGSLSLLIAGDEEGPAINGTRKMLDWLTEKGEQLDACVVGEPTNPTQLGEMIKIGRRGSITFHLTVQGTQGHVAYPDLADNPVPTLVEILQILSTHTLDEGNDYFQPSNLEVTTVDVGNMASNVIPATAAAAFNIRFNTEHTSAEIVQSITRIIESVTQNYVLTHHLSGEPFLTTPCPLSDAMVDAVQKVTGRTPKLSTTGGTSDARYIKNMCPVVEFGLTNQTAHKVDEQTPIMDIVQLKEVYVHLIHTYLSK